MSISPAQASPMRTAIILAGCLLFSCNTPGKKDASVKDRLAGTTQQQSGKQPGTIKDIGVPDGARRMDIRGNSFSAWLRHLSLKRDNRVFLYDNTLKSDQSHHYAVIDISRGDKDLQQCADAIMRIRAEFFYEKGKYDSIYFSSGNTVIDFTKYRKGYRYYLSGNRLLPRLTSRPGCENRACFMQYLETVFAFSGTYNLFDQMKPRALKDMQAGDVFIKAGSPGHAMIVADMAYDPSNGKKYFILAQGFMPAQDIHIVINPSGKKSPWFELDETRPVITPNWTFTTDQLRHW
jgi:hypothetical protein